MEPEWMTLHDFPNYEINQDGIVRKISTGHVMKWNYRDSPYPMVKLTDPEGIQRSKSIYILLVECFGIQKEDLYNEWEHKRLGIENTRELMKGKWYR